jgi:oligopeptide/dipeptide ABC transporter ATP-binding protein
MARDMKPLLDIVQLEKTFALTQRKGMGIERKYVHAVNKVSLSIDTGESFGIVGESGSGKSTLARLIVGLEAATSGTIHYEGRDVIAMRKSGLNAYWKQVQMVFQDPFSSLNPRMRIGTILSEPLRNYGMNNDTPLPLKIAEYLDLVGLPPSAAVRYPHELSGGQRQRVAIAAALAAEPRLVVADEAVSALDVSVQAQIVNLLGDLKQKLGLTYIFITHDLNLCAYFCDRIAVLYLGHVMEVCQAASLLIQPLHPYTKALISAVPSVDPAKRRQRARLAGEIPSPIDPPKGCPFHPRCPIAINRCKQERPLLRALSKQHFVACHVVAP